MRRRPSQWRTAPAWLKGAAVSLLLAVACGKGGVVGGDCVDGFISCDGSCVDPFADSLHCGACNQACDDGLVCDRGECGEGGSSGAAGADGSNGGTANGGTANGGTANGGTANGGTANGGNSATGGSGGVGTGGDGTGGGTGGDGTGGGTGGNGTGGGTGGNGTGGGTGGNGTGGGTGGNGTGGAGTGGAGTGGAGTGGAGTGGAGTGGVGGAACVPPFDTPEACGDCYTECSGGTPVCAPAGSDFDCVVACPPGLTNCNGSCVDLQTDPRNCGRCGNICPSGVCTDGICQGATPGHVAYICMNYAEVFQVSSQTTLLGNAVFLPRRDPVRVLAYSEHAMPAVMNSTDRAIRWAGGRLNREVEITRTPSLNTIETELVLSNYEVFLVYDQPGADSGDLAAAGAQLEATLNAFTIGGGVAVVLSGATGIGEMGQFATAAGLADIGAETAYSSLAYVRSSADVIGIDVISPFQTLDASCTFATSETPSTDTIFVVTDTPPGGGGIGAPIVLHKVVAP